MKVSKEILREIFYISRGTKNIVEFVEFGRKKKHESFRIRKPGKRVEEVCNYRSTLSLHTDGKICPTFVSPGDRRDAAENPLGKFGLTRHRARDKSWSPVGIRSRPFLRNIIPPGLRQGDVFSPYSPRSISLVPC